MLDIKNNYVFENYHDRPVFSSFLPGISGEHGIPLWCYYVNRGQCITSFGVQDKNHSIMEFYPAHQAYERTPLLGFRTFLRINGSYEEAFMDVSRHKKMLIGMNSLTIEERGELYSISVEYETLAQEASAALMRQVKITNTSGKELSIEAADGMTEVIPYGVNSGTMKDMGQTAKAWMEVLDTDSRVPKFKVRASMEDTAEVMEVKGMNFSFARSGGELLKVIVDREVLFGQDTALIKAREFEAGGLCAVWDKAQITCNDVPCSLFLVERSLKPGETLTIQELYGSSYEKENIDYLVKMSKESGWFEKKQAEAILLTKEITDRIATKTKNPVFDAYCRQNYLDNLLRGGYPVRISPKKTAYLYSRKHGDIERDYNFFSMLTETYSQGNGNFRDVNQNRRCDVYFSPFVKDENIKTFYNALQLNGYNPLVIEKVTFRLPNESFELLLNEMEESLKELSNQDIKTLKELSESSYTMGELDKFLESTVIDKENKKDIFEWILDQSVGENRTEFKEGCWCDHWTYNLDLVEAYLSIYPDKEAELLFGDRTYLYGQAEKSILPRKKRYVNTKRGIRQYHFLKANVDTGKEENRWLRDKTGNLVQANLASKMLTLIIAKIAALDPYGMGIEMEGGKPGWYDALNGLPGLSGSSMAETYELKRCISFLTDIVKRHQKPVEILEEVQKLAGSVCYSADKCTKELHSGASVIQYWNMVNDAKEAFWECTAKDVTGKASQLSSEEVLKLLDCFENIISLGIEKAVRLGGSVRPTYFYYEVTDYSESEDGIIPLDFRVCRTPDFLEGSVHSFKVEADKEDKKQIYDSVRASRLYDNKLHMYKVNASLNEATFELGRACAFTPGWLENESVWLHMEYKYLLELLKSELYKEFFEDFKLAAVPFLKEEVYGRSLLENSSFLASSVNPNPKYHGRGFVARLSGSTAEFLEIWEIMMFGKKPFSYINGELSLKLMPCIPSYLIGEEKRVKAVFRGNILVTYELPDSFDIIPGNYRVEKIIVKTKNEAIECKGQIKGELAEHIRDGAAESILVFINR